MGNTIANACSRRQPPPAVAVDEGKALLGQNKVAPMQPQPMAAKRSEPASSACSRITTCFCVLVVLILVLYGGGTFALGYYQLGPALFDLQPSKMDESCNPQVSPSAIGAANNWTKQIWWPGCQTMQLISNMELFSQSYHDHAVSFKSRKMEGHDQVDLSAWVMLPATNKMGGTVPPRVVVQHGFTGNANKFRTQVVAYMLRSLGFTVVAPNLRDHCGSGQSSYQKVAWGYDYPYDLLGAWDYAVKDPENLMGGELPPEKVAIYGASMGAFTTATAFGLEPRIPGVFLDSVVLSPLRAAVPAVAAKLSGLVPLANLILPDVWSPAWLGAKAYLGLDPSLNEPLATLPTGPDTNRPIGLTADRLDSTVFFSNTEELVDQIKGPLANKYNITDTFFTDSVCGNENHVIDQVAHPDQYRETLCTFFSGVFKVGVAYCGLRGLPILTPLS